MKKSVNVVERIKMVKAMEFIARQINDEMIFDGIWLSDGVADGDIDYGDLSIRTEDPAILYYYIQDDHFKDLMTVFLYAMKRAYRSGGLYCNEIVSQ